MYKCEACGYSIGDTLPAPTTILKMATKNPDFLKLAMTPPRCPKSVSADDTHVLQIEE